jgi:WD40 repeat protein/energy-coupling factor transporter ATP-binding protein EcfA2
VAGEQESRHVGLRRAGERAARTGQVAGNALIAVLCAGALAPVAAVPFGVGDLGSAVTGLVGSVGGNVATELLSGAARRLRGRDEGAPLDAQVVEQALADAVARALAGGGEAGAAMRALAAGILREAGAVQAVLAGAAAAPPQAAEALAAGLAGLGEQFGEFAAAAVELRAAAHALQDDVALAAAERRETAARERQLAVLAAQLSEALDAQDHAGGAGGAWTQCPYPGLAPFGEQEARVFYGRRRMTRALVQAVAERARSGGLLLVLGASGAGKSSLLHAGLAPALAGGALGPGSGAWPVRIITPGARPLAELAAQLAVLSGGDAREVEQLLSVAPERAADLAVEAVRAYGPGRGGRRPVLVLVIDQFEELFTLAPAGSREGGQRELFLRALGALAAARATEPGQGRPAAVVLAAVRGDFLDRAAAYPAIASALAAGAFVVEAMTRAQLREAIEGPAAEAGVPIERGLVTAILDEALSGAGALGPGAQALPLVSQALAETWRARRGRGLTLRAYRRVGGLADAADRGAQEVYDRLDERGQRAARAMFLRLTQVSVDGQAARRTVSRTDLHAAAGLDAAAGDAVIDAFTERRLLVAERNGVAICHDVLLDTWRLLHDWLAGDPLDRALYGEVIADAQSWQDGRRELYGRQRLAIIGDAQGRWGRDLDRYPALPSVATRFLKVSRRAATRAAWRRRGAMAALTGLTAAAIGFAVNAQDNASRADAQHRVALSRQLTVESAAVAANDPVLARQFAVTAWSVAPTDEAKQQMESLLADDARAGVITVSSAVDAVAFSPDGRSLVAGTSDGTLYLWDSTTGAPRATIMDVGHTVDAMAFSPDGHTLAIHIGSPDGPGTVQLRDPATGELRSTIADGGKGTAVVFSPDGHTLATDGEDGKSGKVQLWDPATGTLRTTIATRRQGAAVVFSPDGHTLATDGDEYTVQLRDSSTGKLRTTIKDTAVNSMALSPDGHTLAAGSSAGTVRLWDLATGKPRAPVADISVGAVTALAFSPDGHTLATVGNFGTVRLWDPATGKPRTTITGSGRPVDSLAFSPDGHTLAIGSDDRTVRLWDPATGKPRTTITTETTQALLDSVAFSPDGHTLATGSGDGNTGRVQLWDPATGTLRATMAEGAGAVNAVVFSPDGHTLATGSSDGTVRLWDPATGKPRTTIAPTDASPVNLVVFSPDGHTLASNDSDISKPNGVRLWDPATGRLRTTITTGDQPTAVAFSPDGHTLAISSRDIDGVNTVRLWDAATGNPRTSITDTDNGFVRALAFSPDGHTLASSSGDSNELGMVQLWDPATGRLRNTITEAGAVFAAAFSPDGHTLAVGSSDGIVRLWDPATGTLRATMSEGVGAVNAVVFSPDGHTLATGGDSSVIQWPLAVFASPSRTLCMDVGVSPSVLWRAYAPGEPGPPSCASQ